jgi:hypothetical protein
VPVARRGSLFLTNAGEGYAGLGSFGDTDAKGSVFRVLSALFFVGGGSPAALLRFNGVSLGASASSILQLKLLTGGVYSTTTYQAGLARPAAPSLATLTTPSAGFSGKLKNGTYSAKIIKIRAATGVRSLASLVSNTIVVVESSGVGKSARITFPAIGANGADRWGIYVTPKNFGSTGPHYFLKELNEDVVRRTFSGNLTTINGSATLAIAPVPIANDGPTTFMGVANGSLISITDGNTTYSTTVASVTDKSNLQLTLASPFTSTTATATISMSTIDNVPYSHEIEWSDGDLVGGDLAPIDSKQSPAEMQIGQAMAAETAIRANLAAIDRDEHPDAYAQTQLQLAEVLAEQGKFTEAGDLDPQYKTLMEAVDVDDDKKCECSGDKVQTQNARGEPITVEISTEFVAQEVFSEKHGKIVPLVVCSRCGLANAKETFVPADLSDIEKKSEK